MTWPIGVSTWLWHSPLRDSDLAALAPQVSRWGFDVIELPVETPGDWDPTAARRLLDDLGLGATVCLVLGPGRELVATDASTKQQTQDYLRHVIDVAHTVGATAIGGPAYTSVGRTWRMDAAERRAALAEWADAIAPVADHAAQAGVRIAVEPLNRYETSLFNTVAQALEAIADLPDSVGVLLDTYHLNIEEADPVAAIRAAGSRVAHVQVCANDRGAPGHGHLDWPAILDALRDIGYAGPLCIESFTPENQTIAVAASIWRPLAESQDRLATDGLAYLRNLLT
jgi:D-psicose/D-tagatose/L-ribulose 3-epimerase